MSVVSITERAATRTGTNAATGERTYKRVYTVVTSSPGDGPVVVCNAVGLPPLWSYWQCGNEFDAGALCRNRQPKQVDKYIWEVTCHYSTRTRDPDKEYDNPLDKPPERQWGAIVYQKHYMVDKDDKPYVNSAGEPYGREVAARDQSRQTLTITRNEPFFDHSLAQELADTLNKSAFYGLPKGRWKMQPPRSRDSYENGVAFATVTYEMHAHPDGWGKKELDAGSYYWDGDMDDDANKRYPQDGNGVAATAEVLLDGDGGKLTQAKIDASEFEYNEFRDYDYYDWSKLKLEW